MIEKSISTANYEDREMFPLPSGKLVSLKEYGKENLKTMKKASKIDKKFDKVVEDNKELSSDIVSTAFPEVIQNSNTYAPNFIDMIKSIRSDKYGNQYQVPLVKDTGVKVRHFKGPSFMQLIEMFEANYERGGTASYEEFKSDLINGDYTNLFIEPDEFLTPMFGGEMLTRKEGIERQEDLPYEEQDLKGTLFKIIKERTGIGISALFEEEMEDRKKGF